MQRPKLPRLEPRLEAELTFDLGALGTPPTNYSDSTDPLFEGGWIAMLTLLTLDFRGTDDDRRCAGFGVVTGAVGAGSGTRVGCVTTEPREARRSGVLWALLDDTAVRSPRTFVSR